MFCRKTSALLCNCFLFSHFYLHQAKTYHHISPFPLRAIKLTSCHISAGRIMPLQLRSPRHHAPGFRFLLHHIQGKHTPFGGILASLPPHFLYTVAYGMCSVPPHIPYPSTLLRERSYASVAMQPLPAASTFPCPSNLLFLKIFFPMR